MVYFVVLLVLDTNHSIRAFIPARSPTKISAKTALVSSVSYDNVSIRGRIAIPKAVKKVTTDDTSHFFVFFDIWFRTSKALSIECVSLRSVYIITNFN